MASVREPGIPARSERDQQAGPESPMTDDVTQLDPEEARLEAQTNEGRAGAASTHG